MNLGNALMKIVQAIVSNDDAKKAAKTDKEMSSGVTPSRDGITAHWNGRYAIHAHFYIEGSLSDYNDR